MPLHRAATSVLAHRTGPAVPQPLLVGCLSCVRPPPCGAVPCLASPSALPRPPTCRLLGARQVGGQAAAGQDRQQPAAVEVRHGRRALQASPPCCPGGAALCGICCACRHAPVRVPWTRVRTGHLRLDQAAGPPHPPPPSSPPLPPPHPTPPPPSSYRPANCPLNGLPAARAAGLTASRRWLWSLPSCSRCGA